jgi:hypothetical protein
VTLLLAAALFIIIGTQLLGCASAEMLMAD